MIAAQLSEASDESQFGGKAASLARAARSGLPVPPGFALGWELVARIAAGGAFDELLQHFRRLGGRVSVRSSAIGEDSAEASFAGQHLTVLNVVSEKGVIDAIRAVHQSANTPAALEYRARLGVTGEARIGVVVQQMVDSEIAGVLFTRNPLDGTDERVIESAWGLGEAVVAGLITPDRFRLTPRGEIVERTAGVKDLEIRFAGEGSEEREVPEERIRALTLNDQQLAALHDLASKCEAVFGRDIDLEWAFANGDLHLLQSRPITKVKGGQASGLPGGLETRGPVEPQSGHPLTPRRLAGFALAAILSPLNSTMIAVAIPAISTSLAADQATLTLWLVTAYLLVSIVGQSPAGKLADLFGYNPVLTAGRIVFILGALLGAFAPNVGVLAAARILMGLGGALNIPPVLAELRNQVAPERRGRLFGLFGALMGTAAAIGPLAGDVLIRTFGWHSVFLVNLPLLFLSLLLEPPRRAESRPRGSFSFDYGGTLLFVIATSLLVGGMQAKSAAGWIAAAGGVALAALFVQLERKTADPLLDPGLFSIRSFAAGSSIVALQNFTMYATLFLVPFLLATNGGGSAGLYLLAMTGGMVVSSPLGGRVADAIGARRSSVAGALVATAGSTMLFAMSGSAAARFTALAMLGCGIGFSTTPSQAAALSGVPRQQAGAAAGALSTMRYIGGVLGSGLVAVIVSGGRALDLVWLFPAAMLVSAVVSLLLPPRALR